LKGIKHEDKIQDPLTSIVAQVLWPLEVNTKECDHIPSDPVKLNLSVVSTMVDSVGRVSFPNTSSSLRILKFKIQSCFNCYFFLLFYSSVYKKIFESKQTKLNLHIWPSVLNTLYFHHLCIMSLIDAKTYSGVFSYAG